jgi:hypothetical protein
MELRWRCRAKKDAELAKTASGWENDGLVAMAPLSLGEAQPL